MHTNRLRRFALLMAVSGWIGMLMGCADGCQCGGESKAPPLSTAASKPTPSTAPKPTEPVTSKPTEPAPVPEVPKIVRMDQVPDVVAEVNGQPITKAELEARIQRRSPEFSTLGEENQSNVIRMLVEELAISRGLSHEMDKLGLKDDPKALEGELKEALSTFGRTPEEVEKNTGGDSSLRNTMQDGVLQNWRLEQLYQNEILRNVRVNEAEVLDYYNQNKDRFEVPDRIWARILTLNYQPENKGDRQKLAQNLAGQLRSGADFASLARQHSDDPGSKTLGGLNEEIRLPKDPAGTKFDDPYYAWFMASKPQDVSEPLDYTYTGQPMWLIMKNDGLEKGYTISYEEAKSQIERILKEQKAPKSLAEYTQEMNGRIQIQSRLP